MSQPAKRSFTQTSLKAKSRSARKKLRVAMILGDTTATSINDAATSSTLDEPVVYRELKAWIEAQERNPKPLSPRQREAISILLQSREPDLGDRDWVSLLNHFSQSYGSKFSYKDQPAPDQKWFCYCNFKLTPDSEQMSFPDPGEKGTLGPPSFSRKKDAKKYAAKCCVEWLMKAGHMAPDGTSIGTPKSKRAAAAASRNQQASSPAKAGTTTPARAGTATLTKASTASPAKSPVAADDDEDDEDDDDEEEGEGGEEGEENDSESDNEPPVTEQVKQLCHLLGLVAPQYKVTPSKPATTIANTTNTNTTDEMGVDDSSSGSGDDTTDAETQELQQHDKKFGLWDGHADFGRDKLKVPEGISRVTNVLGRRNARNRVAEEVLKWLKTEKTKRELEAEAFLLAEQNRIKEQIKEQE
ncbi:hypothetical protein VTH82DRAFT_803 [Thermothelomyces myriococcoides]